MAMSQENVELVRHYYTILDSVLERYWAAPGGSFTESPLADEVLALLDPDAEWASLIREEPSKGREEALRGVEDWLDAGENWRVEVEELTNVDETRVLATLGVSIRGRGSGVPIGQRLFSIVRVRDGKITGIADHTERHRALEAAGLSE